jgi:hypothetical protein
MRVLSLILLIVLAAACDQTEAPAAPSDPGATQPVVVEAFNGTLAVGGSSFYSFTVTTTGNVSLLLHQLTEAGAPSTAIVTMGLGVPRATDCTATSVVGITAGGSPQLATSVTPAVYCARISDPGNLTAPVTFAINIIRPR